MTRAALYDRACAEPGYKTSVQLTMVHAAAAWEMLQAGFGLELLPGYELLEDVGPHFCPEKKWAQDVSPEVPVTTTEIGENEEGSSPENPIALETGPNAPMVGWATVPKGVTLTDIRETVGLPGVVDSNKAETAAVEVAKKCGGASILAGSGLPTYPMKNPNAFTTRLWKVAGYKVSLWRSTHVGPARKRVRIYKLDEAWTATLVEIASRHYERAMGHEVKQLELIDPRAGEFGIVPQQVARRFWSRALAQRGRRRPG